MIQAYETSNNNRIIYIYIYTHSDSSTFIGCLLKRIAKLLKERDDCIPNPEEWAVNTALNRHQLQVNFTLLNSIKKLMDVQIQHILSYIVSQVDRNYNLDLLREGNNSSMMKFWLSLFNDVMFLQFDYNEIATSSLPVTNVKRQNYCCKFPFSWELIDQIEAAIGKNTQKCYLNEGKNSVTFITILLKILRQVKDLQRIIMHSRKSHIL